MSSKPSSLFSVAVTPNLVHAFEALDVKGQGGFQSLMREVAKRITHGSGVVRFSAEEFTRITRYATSYGEGGFQQRLRLLVSQWTAQHMSTLTKG